MQHAVGRRSGRRRGFVAVITTAMTIATVLAITAPASSAGRAATPAARRAGRSVGTFDVRDRGGAAVAPSARVAQARVALARRLGTQGVVQSDPLTGTLRMVGRLDGFLTARSTRPARTVAMGFVRSNLAAFGLTNADIKTFRLRQDYVDIAGVHHISWTQSKRGIQVFHNGLRANVTADGRLVNVTGSPVHGIRVASTVPRISSAAAIGAARVDGGATRRRRAGLRLGVARPVPDGTRRAARVEDVHVAEHAAAQPVGRGRPERARPVPAEPVERRDRDRDRVGVLSERSGAGRGQHGDPRHVPGRRRHASVRPQRARVGRREGQQQARRRRGDLRRDGNGLEHARDPEHHGRLAGLHHVASVHVGQGRAVQLAGEHGAERGAGHVLPEQVPRPPGRRAVRLHGGRGQLRGAGGQGARTGDGRGQLRQRPPGQEPLQQREHGDAAGRPVPDDADVPVPRGARAPARRA